jgi:hypothetical protein
VLTPEQNEMNTIVNDKDKDPNKRDPQKQDDEKQTPAAGE